MAGQAMLVRGATADPEFQIVAAIAPDDWDRWNDSRDGVLARAISPRYVGQGVVWHRGSGSERRLGQRPRLWLCLAARSGSWLGSLSMR